MLFLMYDAYMWKLTAVLAVAVGYLYGRTGSDAALSAFLLLVYLAAFSYLVEAE